MTQDLGALPRLAAVIFVTMAWTAGLGCARGVAAPHPDAGAGGASVSAMSPAADPRHPAGEGISDPALARSGAAVVPVPDEPGDWEELGAQYEARADLDAALRVYETAMQRFPQRPEFIAGRARVEARRGNMNAALMLLQQARQRWPESNEITRQTGEIYLAAGAYPQALHYLLLAQHQDPDDAQTILSLAELFLARQQFQMGRDVLAPLVGRGTQDARLFRVQAAYYEIDNQWLPEAGSLAAALELEPADDASRMRLARAYMRLERWAEASAELRVLSSTTSQQHAALLLAATYLAEGNMAGLRDLMREKPRIALMLIVGVFVMGAGGALAVTLPLFVARFAGRRFRRPQALLFSHVRWGWGELARICLGLLFIPPALGMVAGGLMQGNWVVVFFATETLASSGAQSALVAQLASMLGLSAYILWRIRRRYAQEWRDVGLQSALLKPAVRDSVQALLMLIFFSYMYQLFFMLLRGHSPQAQTIQNILSASRGHPGLGLLIGHVALLGPLTEELIFRGFVFSGLRRFTEFPLAAGTSAVLFSIYHFHAELFLPIVVLGWVFAWLFERNRSIWPGVAVHAIWNALGLSAALMAR